MTESHRIRISTPAALLGAIPALLGFVPERSVIVILFGSDRLQLVIRIDHDDPDTARIADLARDSARVILVAVAEARYAPSALAQLDRLRAAFDAVLVPVGAAYYTHRLEVGASWTDLDTHATGTVADPATSPVTLAQAVELGRQVAASRADLEARYSAADAAADTTAAVAEYESAPTVFVRDTLTALMTAVAQHSTVDDDLAARVAVLVLTQPAHRDALLALGAIDTEQAREVMAGIARRARGNARVHILTIAGLFAHATGNGAEAAIAYDQARTLTARIRRPAPALLRLAEGALDGVVFPDRIRELFTAATEVTAELGIELPDQT